MARKNARLWEHLDEDDEEAANNAFAGGRLRQEHVEGEEAEASEDMRGEGAQNEEAKADDAEVPAAAEGEAELMDVGAGMDEDDAQLRLGIAMSLAEVDDAAAEEAQGPFMLPAPISGVGRDVVSQRGEFASDAEKLGGANGTTYQRKPGVPNVHDGQLLVRLKKKRFVLLDYGYVPTVRDRELAKTDPHIYLPDGAGETQCSNDDCIKIGVPCCFYDSDPGEPVSLYLRSGLCFECQKTLNEKRWRRRKKKSAEAEDSSQASNLGTVDITLWPAIPLSAAAGAAASLATGKENAENVERDLPPPCRCSKSKCLQLYCACFAASRHCNRCRCTNCKNTPDYESIRRDAIARAKEKNPNAFTLRPAMASRHDLPPPCNCRKSKCLMLYCDCFAALHYCNGCRCTDCRNTKDYESTRQEAIAVAKKNTPRAFEQKNCRCTKSKCLKKYCVCFQDGVVCGADCKCSNCENFEGSQALIDRRKKIEDHEGVEAANAVDATHKIQAEAPGAVGLRRASRRRAKGSAKSKESSDGRSSESDAEFNLNLAGSDSDVDSDITFVDRYPVGTTVKDQFKVDGAEAQDFFGEITEHRDLEEGLIYVVAFDGDDEEYRYATDRVGDCPGIAEVAVCNRDGCTEIVAADSHRCEGHGTASNARRQVNNRDQRARARNARSGSQSVDAEDDDASSGGRMLPAPLHDSGDRSRTCTQDVRNDVPSLWRVGNTECAPKVAIRTTLEAEFPHVRSSLVVAGRGDGPLDEPYHGRSTPSDFLRTMLLNEPKRIELRNKSSGPKCFSVYRDESHCEGAQAVIFQLDGWDPNTVLVTARTSLGSHLREHSEAELGCWSEHTQGCWYDEEYTPYQGVFIFREIEGMCPVGYCRNDGEPVGCSLRDGDFIGVFNDGILVDQFILDVPSHYVLLGQMRQVYRLPARERAPQSPSDDEAANLLQPYPPSDTSVADDDAGDPPAGAVALFKEELRRLGAAKRHFRPREVVVAEFRLLEAFLDRMEAALDPRNPHFADCEEIAKHVIVLLQRMEEQRRQMALFEVANSKNELKRAENELSFFAEINSKSSFASIMTHLERATTEKAKKGINRSVDVPFELEESLLRLKAAICKCKGEPYDEKLNLKIIDEMKAFLRWEQPLLNLLANCVNLTLMSKIDAKVPVEWVLYDEESMAQARQLAEAIGVDLPPRVKMDRYKRDVLMPAMKAANEELKDLALKVHKKLHRKLTNTRYNTRHSDKIDAVLRSVQSSTFDSDKGEGDIDFIIASDASCATKSKRCHDRMTRMTCLQSNIVLLPLALPLLPSDMRSHFLRTLLLNAPTLIKASCDLMLNDGFFFLNNTDCGSIAKSMKKSFAHDISIVETTLTRIVIVEQGQIEAFDQWLRAGLVKARKTAAAKIQAEAQGLASPRPAKGPKKPATKKGRRGAKGPAKNVQLSGGRSFGLDSSDGKDDTQDDEADFTKSRGRWERSTDDDDPGDGAAAGSSKTAKGRCNDEASQRGNSAPPNAKARDFVYEGERENGKAHGKGVCKFTTTVKVLEGDWVNGKLHGRGKMTLASGRVYDGEWKDGKIHGTGKMSYENGKGVYDGQWVSGKRHGRGIYEWGDGGLYDGEWQGNERHGRGAMKWNDGKVYEGEWENKKKHGAGTMTLANGTVYDGEWENGKLQRLNHNVYEGERDENGRPHGRGKLTWKNLDVYDGQWVAGKLHGTGTYTFADGSVYEGEYRDGKKQGKGVYESSSGNVYDGEYRDGKLHGTGTFVWADDGRVYEGEWVESKPHGKGTFTYANGDVYEGELRNGKRHGRGKMRYESAGDVYCGEFVAGKRHDLSAMLVALSKPEPVADAILSLLPEGSTMQSAPAKILRSAFLLAVAELEERSAAQMRAMESEGARGRNIVPRECFACVLAYLTRLEMENASRVSKVWLSACLGEQQLEAIRTRIYKAYAALHGCSVEDAAMVSEVLSLSLEELRSKADKYDEMVAVRCNNVVSLLLECRGLLRELHIDPCEEDAKIVSSLKRTAGHGDSFQYTVAGLFETSNCIGIGNSALERLNNRIRELSDEKERPSREPEADDSRQERPPSGVFISAQHADSSGPRAVQIREAIAVAYEVRDLGRRIRKGEELLRRPLDVEETLRTLVQLNGVDVCEVREQIRELWDLTKSTDADAEKGEFVELCDIDIKILEELKQKMKQWHADLGSEECDCDLCCRLFSILPVECQFLSDYLQTMEGERSVGEESEEVAPAPAAQDEETATAPKVSLPERLVEGPPAEAAPPVEGAGPSPSSRAESEPSAGGSPPAETSKEAIVARLEELGKSISALWKMLQIPREEQEAFTASSRRLRLGKGLLAFEAELARLEELKSVIGKLIGEQREMIQDLWDKTHATASEKAAFDQHYHVEEEHLLTSKLLEQHQRYAAALEAKLEKMQPILDLIAKRERIIEERNNLEFLQKDPDRFNGRGAIARAELHAKEEKMNRRVMKGLPKLTAMLEVALKGWHAENKPQAAEEGQIVNPDLGHFMYQGAPYLQTMESQEEEWRTRKERERQAKREQRPASARTRAHSVNRGGRSDVSRAGSKPQRRYHGDNPRHPPGNLGPARSGSNAQSVRRGPLGNASIHREHNAKSASRSPSKDRPAPQAQPPHGRRSKPGKET